MGKERMKVFGETNFDFDVSGFEPKPKEGRAPKKDVRTVTEALDFKSREAPAQKRSPRRHRTGRTAQLNVRTRPETVDAVYKIADEEGWLVGETVEHAIKALQRERLARQGS